MELQQLSTSQLNELPENVCIESSLRICEGSVPPKHVLNRSHEQLQNSKLKLWALPYMMLVESHVVGFCGFKNNPENGEVEIGYNVSPHQQGQGFAKLAVNLLCQLAFDASPIERVVALISSTNIASLHVVRANNFSFESVVDSDNEKLEKWALKRSRCA